MVKYGKACTETINRIILLSGCSRYDTRRRSCRFDHRKGTVMNKFLERLNSGEILVADGATGSNLQRMGLKPGKPPEDLIIDNPDILLKLASSFVEAGSDIILTCTFGGTRLRMKDSKYQDRAPEVNMRAVEIARKAASAG